MKDSSPLDSRKYRLALFCLMALLTGLGVSMLNPVAAKLYLEFTGSVISVLFVYCGGNVANKWTTSKVKSLTPNEGESTDGPVS